TEAILDALRPPLESGKPKVGQNVKYDYVVLRRHGLEVQGPFFDTMVAHYLIEPEGLHGLDLLARKYLSYQMIPITDLIGTGRVQKSMRDVPIGDVGCYSCEDADVTLQLADLIEPELAKTGVRQVAEEIEFPLIPVLADMEMQGIYVAPDLLKEISAHLATEIAGLESAIYDMCGEPFNIGSPQQLGEILFDRLCLRVVSKTSKGMPSTRENVLRELATEHPLPGLILDWRQLTKLKSTYVDTLGDLIHPETGRIHTNFNQTVAATGRLSSQGPNLQNIPVRTEMGREIRKAFVPRPGWKLLSADYVQIELRILASMSGDDALREAFEAGEDVHTSTAARVFGIPISEVTTDQRRKAKEVNYGIPYGVSGWGLAQRLRTSTKEAQDLIDQYQRSYPGVARFLALQVDEARQKGYVETLMGRRRYVPNINARNRMERSFAERVAVNMPIQGTQADMIKIAMIHIHDRLHREGLRSKMLLQVHDELVFECPPEEVETVRSLAREEMVSALPLKVPIEVDVGVGDNWLDAH
ncbi:MAG TPA: DNA polymerase I, partial [Rhodothermales bacterium]